MYVYIFCVCVSMYRGPGDFSPSELDVCRCLGEQCTRKMYMLYHCAESTMAVVINSVTPYRSDVSRSKFSRMPLTAGMPKSRRMMLQIKASVSKVYVRTRVDDLRASRA